MNDEFLREFEDAINASGLTAAGGRRPFVRALAANDAVKRLSALARGDEDIAWTAALRIIELAMLNIDVRYSNPYDVVIAAYVMALSGSSPEITASATAAVAAAPNCWWAPQLVSWLNTQSTRQSGVESVNLESATATYETPSSAETLIVPGYFALDAIRPPKGWRLNGFNDPTVSIEQLNTVLDAAANSYQVAA